MDDATFDEVRSALRRWVREQVVPIEQQIEDDDAIPSDIIAEARNMGLYGFALPVEYGGLGATMTQEAQMVFELGYTTPALRSLFGTNNGIAGHVLLEGGTDAQRRELLPKLASGDWTASFALTEEAAGSDPKNLATTAHRDGEDWVIGGTKRYTTNAPVADVFMVFARTGQGPRRSDGISAFVVPSSSTGLTVAPKDAKMGQAGAWTADVHLDEVRVPHTALVGGDDGLGTGFATAMRCLAHGRLHIAALCCGLSERLRDESVRHAATRHQGGKPIGEHQLIQALLADTQTELLAGRSLVLEMARAYDAGERSPIGPSAAKYFCSEAVDRAADRAVQIHGGAGYMRGVPAERFYRDARLFRIYEGTSQIQQIIIGRALVRQAT